MIDGPLVNRLGSWVRSSSFPPVDMANAMKVADAANSMVQKAGLAVGFATQSDYAKYRVALGSLAQDFIAAQVLAPMTFGASGPIALLAVATNRDQPGQCAFKTSGQLVHSIPIQPGVRP